jgi:predicted PhzF superfamily epimerase YddE/YHI9
VDAFAERPFAGNPAAVCLLEEPADEAWMQALAAEMGLSETAFVWPEGDLLSLRWFTPTTEVDLCGHATVAAAHALREAGRVLDAQTISFATRSGVLGARPDGDMVELDLPAERAEAAPLPPTLSGLAPVATARGPGVLLVELADAAAVRGAEVDLGAVADLDIRALYVTAAGDDGAADYVLRVFAPAVGIDEDPVTGSAQCLLGPYWAERLGRTTLEALQLSRRGGRLTVTVRGERVSVAGRAVTVVEGRVALS